MASSRDDHKIKKDTSKGANQINQVNYITQGGKMKCKEQH